jgi:hypothetical protein
MSAYMYQLGIEVHTLSKARVSFSDICVFISKDNLANSTKKEHYQILIHRLYNYFQLLS